MTHLRSISRKPELAISIGGGRNTSLAEQFVLIGLSLVFGDWQNFQQVYSNLQKFYSKTPEE